jgi:hypothetical protein
VQRNEIQHNTYEQVRTYLAEALEMTEASECPEDLRVAFFAAAANMLASKQVVITQAAPVQLGGLGIDPRTMGGR